MIRLTLIVALLIVGCDRAPRPKALPTPPRTTAEFRQIAQLAPNRPVHVAIDTLGNVFYTVETENGQDGVIVVSENGLPRATKITSANILAELGESVGGSGSIQDIAADPDGGILFYFSGGKGRAVRSCIGHYLPRGESLRILFDTKKLIELSGMGESIELSRGTLIPMGARMHLLLRHTDAWAFFSFNARRPAPGEQPRLDRPFKVARTDEAEIDLTRQRYELSPGPGESLALLDRARSELWQLDPATGHASIRLLLAGLPREISKPLLVKQDELLFFIADSEPVDAEISEITRQRLPRTSYPAFLRAIGKDLGAIGREDFIVPGGFPAYAIRIHQLIRASDGNIVAYDMNSGQLMRININWAQ